MVSKPTILDEKIFIKKSSYHWFWQCLAMMPGTSRSAAASIIGGMTQGLSRKAAEFSFFLCAYYVGCDCIFCVCENVGKRN
jgi:undecaprenyl pyrophosphate phosphatase UppP